MRRWLAVIIFLVGIGCICYGLYHEVFPGIKYIFGFSWLRFSSKVGNIVFYFAILVGIWGGIYLVGKVTDSVFQVDNDSRMVKGVGNLIWGIAILATLVLLGSIIFEIGRHSSRTDDPNQRPHPTQIR